MYILRFGGNSIIPHYETYYDWEVFYFNKYENALKFAKEAAEITWDNWSEHIIDVFDYDCFEDFWNNEKRAISIKEIITED